MIRCGRDDKKVASSVKNPLKALFFLDGPENARLNLSVEASFPARR
jgi:hypothetical protein